MTDISVLLVTSGGALIVLGVGLLYSYRQAKATDPSTTQGPPPELRKLLCSFIPEGYVCIGLGATALGIGVLTDFGEPLALRQIQLPVTAWYAVILGALLVLLTFNVFRTRVGGILEGRSQDDATVTRIVRVHGNFTEYVPTGLILLLLAEYNGAAPMLVHVGGVVFTLGRAIHAYGYTRAAVNMGRVLGIQLTLLALAYLVVLNGILLV